MSYILVADTPCRVLAKTKTQKQALFIGAGVYPYRAIHTFNLNKGKKALSKYDAEELADMAESLCGQRPPVALSYKNVLATVYNQLLYLSEARPVVPKAFSGGGVSSSPVAVGTPPTPEEAAADAAADNAAAQAAAETATAPPPPAAAPAIPAAPAPAAPARPKAGTVASNCWDIYDSLVKAGTPPAEAEQYVDYAVSVGVNAATARTQYKKWFDSNGLPLK